MLTPAFDLSQDSDFLTIAIRLPYARVSEFDVYFEGVDFKFYAKPYFLRLTLPGRIVENGSEQGSYDADKGIFTLRLPKETPGQHFEGLNMLTALLAPRKSRTAKPLVEEMGACEDSEEVEHDDEEFDWEIEQTPYEEESESALYPQCRYGFGNLRSGVVQRLQDELSEVIDIKNPDDTPAAERRQKRLAAELAKFDPDHYLADFFEGEAVEQILKYSPWWNDTYSKMLASFEDSQEQEIHAVLVSFSEEEKYQLRKFVNKSYLLDKTAHHQVYYSLIDILLAYCYEIRVTEGERSVESAWSIRKLSPTLCWFETWTNVHEVLVAFGRRVLCYPLYRHFKLVTKAHRDTVKILQLGKSVVLKCLLDIHKIFQENDPAYILNDLYISDYCVWIQKTKSEKLSSLAKALKEASLTKAQLGLELEELEAAALLVQKEETGRKAACSVSTQTLGSSPEASDSEGSESESESGSGSGSGSESGPDSASSSSSSSSSSGPEDPASEQEELRGSLSAPATSLQGPFVHTSSALLVGEGVACVHTACQTRPQALAQAPGARGPLIEELGEQLRTTLQVSQPEYASAGCHSSMWDSDEATGAQ